MVKKAILEIFEEIAKYVAESFMEDMREFGFDSFIEMANAYWLTAKDVKYAVDCAIREYAKKVGNESIYLSDDGADVFANGDFITYRKFSTLWRKYLKDNWRTDNDNETDSY